MPRGPMSPEEKVAAAERLARGRLTALANREERARLGIKKPLTPKQKQRMKKMSAAKKAREAAVNEAITAALSPVTMKSRDHAGEAARAAERGRSYTPQEAAAAARARKGLPGRAPTVTVNDDARGTSAAARGIYEIVEAFASTDAGAAIERQLSQLRERIFEKGEDPEAAVRAMWGRELADAPSKLRTAIERRLALPRTSPRSSSLTQPTPAMSVDDRLAYYRLKLENKFALWRPYPKQLQFLAMGADKRERMLRGGNKTGKCIFYNELIEHPDGTATPIGVLYERREPFMVNAWDGYRLVPVRVERMVMKPPEPGLRLFFKNGRTLDCAAQHRMLDAAGRWHFSRQLVEGLPCLPPSSSEFARSAREQGAPHYWGTVRDFLAHCFAGLRSDGGRPLVPSAVAQSSPTLQVGAPAHIRSSLPSGDRGRPTDTSNLCAASVRRPNVGGLLRSLARSVAFSARAAWHSAPPSGHGRQGVLRFCAASASLLRSAGGILLGRPWRGRPLASPLYDGNAILAYSLIPAQSVYDLTVPRYENYVTAGVVHHNTYTGAGEVVAHLTGRYPDWWEGIRFNRPTLVWSGGADGIAVRDGPQTLLCGLPGDRTQLGTGMIPKDLIVGDPPSARSAPNGIDSVIVRHISGGSSKLVFKTYAQGDGHGTGSWEGPYVDAIWLDEEAPMAVYNEALARLTGQGRIFTTFTPKIGFSQLVKRFLRENHEFCGVVQITLEEAEHFTAEEKAQRRAGYSENERAYREYGDPSMGEGSVFGTPEQDLRSNFSISTVPDSWRKIWGLDFGSNHPFAAVLWGFDLENDMDYVLHCIKMRTSPTEPSILMHCEAIKRVCAQAPVAWPHDGAVSRNGEALKDVYAGHGLKMLETHALNAQGNHYTQPGIDALDTRMQERRLFVRNSPENEAWFEEYRAYHRKVDPHTNRSHIVKDFDDLMSATRIGYIMKARARPVPLGGPAPVRRRPAIRDFDLFTGQPIQPGGF